MARFLTGSQLTLGSDTPTHDRRKETYVGELIHLTCTGCDVDRQDYLGLGMSGQLRMLCACDHCHRVVIDEGKWTSPPWRGRLRRIARRTDRAQCPDCKRKVRLLYPRAADDDKTSDGLGACPMCQGTLHGRFKGLWD